MLKNYLVTAVRNIRKNGLTSLITIVGFSIGIACALFIFLYVQYEFSFDKFFPGHERVYRVLLHATTFEGSDFLTSSVNENVKYQLLVRNNGIENLTQIIPTDALLGYDNRFFYEQNDFYLSDPSFLKVFGYPLAAGDGNTALKNPMSIVLTRRAAMKYFGDEDPIGKTISFKNNLMGETVYYFTVTGVLDDLPPNSTFQFDFVAYCPFERLLSDVIAYYNRTYKLGAVRDAVDLQMQTYVLLKSNMLLPLFQKGLDETIKRISTSDMRVLYQSSQFVAEPLDRIYLFSKVASPYEKKGNFLFILLMAGLAVIVILIACINVINLTTARSLTRVKEIGIRKALGASRKELILQYLVESVLLSFISLWFAVVIVEVLLPLFNVMIKRNITIDYLGNPAFLLAIIGIAFLIGILSGFYPAFYLSSLNANNVLKDQKTPSSRRFREIMVVVQFVFSIGLFISSAVILREFKYMKNTDLGLDSKDVAMVRLNIPEVEKRYPDIKKAVSAVPGVLGVTGSSFAAWEFGQLVSDMPVMALSNTMFTQVMIVDPDYLRIYKIGLIKGVDFDPEGSRNLNQLIINETAQKLFGYDLDSFIYNGPLTGYVAGIAKDFNYQLPSAKIKPLIMTTRSPFIINTTYAPAPVHLNYMLVKIQSAAQQQVIQDIESTWKSLNPGYSFEYKMAEREMSRQLDEYNYSFESILDISTVLAFLLSGLGLFGLASFEIERRTKEVGIRKALGATSRQIVIHFLLGFLKLIALANVIAWPLTFIFIRLVFGLIQYPHRLLIGPLVFLEVGIVSVAVMVVTVGSQTLRAARSNPVDTLRYE